MSHRKRQNTAKPAPGGSKRLNFDLDIATQSLETQPDSQVFDDSQSDDGSGDESKKKKTRTQSSRELDALDLDFLKDIPKTQGK